MIIKEFFKRYWPFIPLAIIVTIAFLAIIITMVSNMYSYYYISINDTKYQSDNNYYDNSLRN